MPKQVNQTGLDGLGPTSTERLVALDVGSDGTATLFVRTENGAVTSRKVPFHPWLLVADHELCRGLETVEVKSLGGGGPFRFRAHFATAAKCAEASRELKSITGIPPTSANAPYRTFSDYQQLALSTLPERLFRGMQFGDLRRLQLDIETLTTPGFDFPNAERPDDRIVLIAMRDSTGWEECLGPGCGGEKELLERMVECIVERDPDVIEGHNIFSFDLPYIETRSKMLGVKLRLGRGRSLLKSRPSRFTSGERVSSYRRYVLWGRHIVDTMHLAQLYDVSHRDLDSYGLKSVARHFGVSAPERTYVDGSEITEIFHRDPDKLVDYALDDVRETDGISRVLSPSYFYQAQVVPFSYQSCVTRGNAARIDAMLVADYMMHDTALPRPLPPRPFSGGLTESFASGVFHGVWHIDVQSLYPSIIVSRGIGPATDTLGSFNSMLSQLRSFRLAAKKSMRKAEDRAVRDHFDALQGSFKVLINSFYGYLGFRGGTFNDFDQAETVTAEGRRILSSMVDFLESVEAEVIEIDTDGIYFVPPKGVMDRESFTGRVQEILPEGIEVELDAVYRTMFSYKAKNYALLAEDGTISITGAALRSRGLEPFQTNYIRSLIQLLLEGRPEQAASLRSETERAIVEHAMPLATLAKRETLSMPPETYRQKLEDGKTRRSAAYELVLNSDRDYRQGDQVAFYVTGNRKNVAVVDAAKLLSDADPEVRDENVAYYLGKLEKLHAKFAPFVGRGENSADLSLFQSS